MNKEELFKVSRLTSELSTLINLRDDGKGKELLVCENDRRLPNYYRVCYLPEDFLDSLIERKKAELKQMGVEL